MANLTLKQLRYFVALAAHGHFGRAADACAISQPALSLQIKALEAALGGPLVERSPQGVRPTALGDALLGRAERVLQEIDQLVDLGRAAADEFVGRFRIGVIPTIAPYLLAEAVAAMRTTFPNLAIEPREAVTRALLSEIRSGGLDAALLALPISEVGLQEFELFEEEFVLVRPRAEAHAPPPPVHRLRELRLLLLEEGHCFRDQALAFCEIRPNDARFIMEGSSLSTLVRMVEVGLGVTLIPEMAVRFERRRAAVAIDRLTEPAPKRRIGLVWRDNHPLGARFAEAGDVVRRAWEEVRSAPPASAPA